MEQSIQWCNDCIGSVEGRGGVIGSAFCPKDLMIGNFVNRKYYNPHPINPTWELERCEVCGIRQNSVIVKIKGGSHINQNYWEGIVLTKEWIELFGFEKRTTIGHSVQYFTGINPITQDWLFDILWQDSQDYPFYRNGHFKIKYVHQLQNLFYCLTGHNLVLS